MRQNGKTRIRWFFSRVGLTFLSIVLLFALLEIGFRIKIFYDDQQLIRASRALSGNTSFIPRETKQLRYLIRWSSNPRIIYELIPNLSIVFKNHYLTTNSRGVRGPAYPEEKNKNTVRIIGLGDSYMFGWRVGEDEYYLSLLSDYLNHDFPNCKFEVINLAVPGYNTVMETETLKEKGLRYDPDLVIIHFTGNDFDLPNFIRAPADYFTIRKSYFLEFLEKRIRNSLQRPEDVLIPAPRSHRQHRFEHDPARVPEMYRDMVGEGAFRRAMRELSALSREHDFKLILFSDTTLPPSIKDFCSRLDIPVVEAGPAIQNYMREHKIERYRHSPLVITRNDDHPSPVAHRIFADVIYDYLRNSGVITQLIEKKGCRGKGKMNKHREDVVHRAGSPWENGYTESCNGKFRDEFPNREILDTLLEETVLTAWWRIEYNELMPHTSLGYRPQLRQPFAFYLRGGILTKAMTQTMGAAHFLESRFILSN